MSFGIRDIRNLYPRITEKHLRYLEKWGLVRPSPARGDGDYTFVELAGASHWIPDERPEELAAAVLAHLERHPEEA